MLHCSNVFGMMQPFARGRWLFVLSVLFLTWGAVAHPIPDIPVRAFFDRSSDARIEIEIDPRFFTDDPMTAPYLFKKEFDAMLENERSALLEKAKSYAARAVAFHFDPVGEFFPAFEYRFTGMAGAVMEKDDDPVMMTGSWITKLQPGLTGYRVKALQTGGVSIVVINSINGHQLKRIHVLFPGESSYVLDLTGLTEKGQPSSTMLNFQQEPLLSR